MKILDYTQFTKENLNNSNQYLPSYEDCVSMCQVQDSPFYESKFVIDGL
jgi:hypothetical protein